ncbi:MAG: 5'-nucleosidase [Bdellovibrio sp. CG10_big_fil_rev_8_21_14_0_10_47_8]|nr:MAG: 5'-nucleosidase [Bdellovibrio sp. CG10_big_fil_rev_8_21_14_0_10_47_8]
MALPMETQGLFEHLPVHYCGIGKINAAHKTTEVILKTNCRHILNLGTAGSHRFHTHSLVECSSLVQRDMDLSPLGFPLGDTPMDEVKGKISLPRLCQDLPHGTCGTGDRFEVGPPQLDCDMVDMEAYAIAKVCQKMKVNFSGFKYITDGSDHQAHEDWYKNLKPGAERLLQLFESLVRHEP